MVARPSGPTAWQSLTSDQPGVRTSATSLWSSQTKPPPKVSVTPICCTKLRLALRSNVSVAAWRAAQNSSSVTSEKSSVSSMPFSCSSLK